MRLINALKADIKFQFKQGFYLVYVFITIGYLIVVQQLPSFLQKSAVPLIVFTDPALIGFFFIGGIIMLERVQGIFNYLLVTPLRTKEYMISKIISLSITAVFASIAITAGGYKENVNVLILIIAIFLISIFATLLGIIAAINCRTINAYFIKMIPYILFLVLPCIASMMNKEPWLFLFPSVVAFELLKGAFNGITITKVILIISYLLFLNTSLLIVVEKLISKKRVNGGL